MSTQKIKPNKMNLVCNILLQSGDIIMSWMKVLVLKSSITILTCSLLASLTTIANAKPFVEKVKIQIPNNEISGNIIKGNTTVENIFCERIVVTLTEFIPNEPQPGKFNIPTQRPVGQAVTATGNHIGEGCTYSLGFRYSPKIRASGVSTFKIRAHTIDGIVGEQSVSYPFSNNIDIQLFPPPPPLR